MDRAAYGMQTTLRSQCETALRKGNPSSFSSSMDAHPFSFLLLNSPIHMMHRQGKRNISKRI